MRRFHTSGKHGVVDDDIAIPADSTKLCVPGLLDRGALSKLEYGIEAHNDIDANDAEPEQPELPLLGGQSE